MVTKREKDGVKQYVHDEHKRVNNPPVGLVTAETDKLNGKITYRFDPHLDPQLQWAGKTEGTSFDVDTVSLHVHERIDPLTIIEAVRKRDLKEQRSLFHWFETKENNPPIREAIEFYRHAQGWSNRLIAGDSLLVMNSLLEKESMAGKVQMIYIDPPYGIKYGSNFQPFVNKRQVKDGSSEDLTQEPEMVRAFRDTWELGIHSYLTYLRHRLLLARELLHESGSCFVQISDENLHHVKELMDEVFGHGNLICIITYITRNPTPATVLASNHNYLLWYCKDRGLIKYRKLLIPTEINAFSLQSFGYVELENGKRRMLSEDEKDGLTPLPQNAKLFNVLANITSPGHDEEDSKPITFNGTSYPPPQGSKWSPSRKAILNLIQRNRIYILGNTLATVRYLDDFPFQNLSNVWEDVVGGFGFTPKIFVVQTNIKIVKRCLLMTTDPGDLVLDPTCGSGTTAYVAEQWGRRWITCDTSRVAITLAKQRLMTSIFDYYELTHPKEGISSGLNYRKAAHITIRSIANNEPPQQELLYDQPIVDRSKKRVTGPFTSEAVPSLGVRSFEEVERTSQEADVTIARVGETLKENEWIDEMLSTGIRGKGGQTLEFVRIEHLGGTKWIQAAGETIDGQNVVISFGPEYAPLEPRQVELAVEEAQTLVPKPKTVLFAAFQFDPEAAKDIDELKWPGVNVLKVQMNTDLFTSDLKKKRTSSEAFWLVGQPDVEIKKQGNKYVVTVNGFDYYNTKTGEIESGGTSKIAMWELDTDYDGRSLYPRQVFFPIADAGGGWNKLADNLKAQIDEELIENYRGNTSLPFKLGNNKQIAVKIMDDRGIESLKIIRVRE